MLLAYPQHNQVGLEVGLDLQVMATQPQAQRQAQQRVVGGGAGGAGVSTANTQNSGVAARGGGSGGLSSTTTNRKGGDGARGQVVLTWIYEGIDPPTSQQPVARWLKTKIASY